MCGKKQPCSSVLSTKGMIESGFCKLPMRFTIQQQLIIRLDFCLLMYLEFLVQKIVKHYQGMAQKREQKII